MTGACWGTYEIPDIPLEQISKALFYNRRQGIISTLVGTMFSVMLQTIATLQFIRWCERSWSKDRKAIRFLVIWMISVGTAFTLLKVVRAIQLYAVQFGQWAPFLDQSRPRVALALMSIASLSSEVFYIYRLYALSGNSRWLLAAFGFAWILVAGLSTATVAVFPNAGLKMTPTILWICSAEVASIAALDLAITFATMWFLYKRRNKSAEGRGNSLIKRLILLAAQTQLPVSIVALILCIADSMCITYLNPTGFCLITGLTQTTLLKVLNSRRSIRDKVGLTVTPSADLEESMQSSTQPVTYAQTDYEQTAGYGRTDSSRSDEDRV